MGYLTMLCDCCACGTLIQCNPDKVPSLRLNGKREPLCRACFGKWNEVHRTSKGLDPVALDPEAYSPLDENAYPEC